MIPRNPGKVFLLACWLPAIAAVQASCLALAWRTYPHYSMFEHEISDLGDPVHNPAGWWFWSLAMAFAAFMLRPVTDYVLSQMAGLTTGEAGWRRKLVGMGSVASRFAFFGLIGLALIPQYRALDAAHQVAGVFAFGGMYVTVLFFCCVPLWGTSLSPAKALLSTLGACWGPVGFLATQGYRFFAYGEVGDVVKVRNQSVFLRFTLWEWMLFFCLMTSLVLLVLLLPSKQRPEINPSCRPYRLV